MAIVEVLRVHSQWEMEFAATRMSGRSLGVCVVRLKREGRGSGRISKGRCPRADKFMLVSREVTVWNERATGSFVWAATGRKNLRRAARSGRREGHVSGCLRNE